MAYALDDTYIHMAMAKSFAQHGVWGITAFGFSSTSSSLLWTLVLSLGFWLFSVNVVVPFVLNLLAGTLLLFVVSRVLRQQGMSSLLTFLSLVLVIFLTPLAPLIFTGQEHILQTAVTVALAHSAARALALDPDAWRARRISGRVPLLVLAPLVTLARYEGLFLMFVVCVLFLLRRRVVFALLLGGAALLPLVIYGLISVAEGWYFVPNSVLLKGNEPLAFSAKGIALFVYSGGRRLTTTPHMLSLVLAVLATCLAVPSTHGSLWSHRSLMKLIFLATTALHALFANFGGFHRYEAYLVVLGLVALGIGLQDGLRALVAFRWERGWLSRYAGRGAFVLLLGFCLIHRGLSSHKWTPEAVGNIYDQQCQMGKFLRRFYEGQAVAVNDIGAVSFFGNVDTLDLWGLACMDVARARRQKCYDTQRIDNIARRKKARIAIVYDGWFAEYGGIPPNWNRAGTWTLPENYACARPTVAFYAIDVSESGRLLRNLRAFSPLLPKHVVQAGPYTSFPSAAHGSPK